MTFQKRHNIWKGRKHTEKSKLKISLSKKGISNIKLKGKKLSQEHINKIVLTRKQNNSYKPNSGCFQKGKSHVVTKETRAKISEGNKGQKRNNEIKKKLSNSHLGRKRQEWEKVKIKNTWNTSKYKNIAKERRANQILPIKDTSIEVKIQNFLKQLNMEFKTHQYININHAYQVDVFIPSKSLIIECDGNYWHNYPYGREIDKIRTKELQEKGFKVLRLWECDINKMTIKEFEEILL